MLTVRKMSKISSRDQNRLKATGQVMSPVYPYMYMNNRKWTKKARVDLKRKKEKEWVGGYRDE